MAHEGPFVFEGWTPRDAWYRGQLALHTPFTDAAVAHVEALAKAVGGNAEASKCLAEIRAASASLSVTPRYKCDFSTTNHWHRTRDAHSVSEVIECDWFCAEVYLFNVAAGRVFLALPLLKRAAHRLQALATEGETLLSQAAGLGREYSKRLRDGPWKDQVLSILDQVVANLKATKAAANEGLRRIDAWFALCQGDGAAGRAAELANLLREELPRITREIEDRLADAKREIND